MVLYLFLDIALGIKLLGYLSKYEAIDHQSAGLQTTHVQIVAHMVALNPHDLRKNNVMKEIVLVLELRKCVVVLIDDWHLVA